MKETEASFTEVKSETPGKAAAPEGRRLASLRLAESSRSNTNSCGQVSQSR